MTCLFLVIVQLFTAEKFETASSSSLCLLLWEISNTWAAIRPPGQYIYLCVILNIIIVPSEWQLLWLWGILNTDEKTSLLLGEALCICLCLGLETLLNTFIRGMSYSSNEIWSSVWYFYYGGLWVSMNIVIEYLVLFSTTMQTTMIYVIVSTCLWSYIVWSNSQGSSTHN